MTPHPDGPVARVVLVGFMAAGKTAVGAALARRLGWTHVDLDRVIEAREGRSIPEIFAHDGEARFRALEAEATASLADQSGVVLTPGGGWITRPGLLESLGPRTLSVWLKVSPEEAVRRSALEPGERPLLAGPDPLAAARRILAEREALYARADLHLDTEGRSPEAAAAIIEQEVRARGGPDPIP